MNLPLRTVDNPYGDATDIVDRDDRLIAEATSSVYAGIMVEAVNKLIEARCFLKEAKDYLSGKSSDKSRIKIILDILDNED